MTNANLQPKVDNLTKNRPGSGTKDQHVQRESYIIGGTNREREENNIVKSTDSHVGTQNNNNIGVPFNISEVMGPSEDNV